VYRPWLCKRHHNLLVALEVSADSPLWKRELRICLYARVNGTVDVRILFCGADPRLQQRLWLCMVRGERFDVIDCLVDLLSSERFEKMRAVGNKCFDEIKVREAEKLDECTLRVFVFCRLANVQSNLASSRESTGYPWRALLSL
jgi:hypothetical protein